VSVITKHNITIAGAGTQAMLFAHGFGCDQNMSRFVAPAFERRYRTVLFDHVLSVISHEIIPESYRNRRETSATIGVVAGSEGLESTLSANELVSPCVESCCNTRWHLLAGR
jgi:sigma-B regulation protein RsbQ